MLSPSRLLPPPPPPPSFQISKVVAEHQQRWEKLHDELREDGMDKDSYLARLINDYETQISELKAKHAEEISRKEAEK